VSSPQDNQETTAKEDEQPPDHSSTEKAESPASEEVSPAELEAQQITFEGPPDEITFDQRPLEENVSRGRSLTKGQIKESSARAVAKMIVQIFGGVLFAILVGGFTVIGLYGDSIKHAEALVGKTVVPFLTALGNFSSTVFAPLLAFILGYYFGEKQQGEPPADTENEDY
jgi:hypothetical protein